MNTKPGFIIVGGGLAGAIAAQTLREEGFDGRITLLGQETRLDRSRVASAAQGVSVSSR